MPSKKSETGEAKVARRTTKIAQVIEHLQQEEGATLDQLVEVTGWQPHSVRAALTSLKKKGHAIDKVKRGEVTCYKISETA